MRFYFLGSRFISALISPSNSYSVAAQNAIIVTIEVGTEHVQYSVYQSLLTHYSEYFVGALRNSWQEANTDKVVLDDIGPTTCKCNIDIFKPQRLISRVSVNVFLNWLYTQTIPKDFEDWIRIAGLKISESQSLPREQTVFQSMIKALAFGDRFIVPEFKRGVHNRIIDLMSSLAPTNSTIICAYDNVPFDTDLLDFIITIRCINPSGSTQEEIALSMDLPREFLVKSFHMYDIMLHHSPIEGKINPCDCHHHGSNEERANCLSELIVYRIVDGSLSLTRY